MYNASEWKTIEYHKSHLYFLGTLTYSFHGAVHLFSSRSQMTSRCGRNKQVAREPIGK